MQPQNLMALGDGENDVEMLQVCFTVLAHPMSVLHAVRMRTVSRTVEAVQLPASCKRSEQQCMGCEKEMSLVLTSDLTQWTLHSHWQCSAVQLAGLGVAVANAGGPAKAAADVVMQETNDQDAVARAIERFVLSQS